MAEVRDAIAPQPVDRKLLSERHAWPKDSDQLYVELIEDLFVNGDLKVTIECSFDAVSWVLVSTDTFRAGHRSRDGSARFILLGPFKSGPRIQNPTHVRLTMEPVTGTPVCGLKSNGEPDPPIQKAESRSSASKASRRR